MKALLEVIALGPGDVAGAQEGGADRLELVSDIDAGGLTPAVETLRAVKRESDIPVRVMLRANDGFATTGSELSRLKGAAQLLAAAGADGFVLGFLGPTSEIDVDVTLELIGELGDLPWTHHRAIDNALDYDRAWQAIRGLPGMDTVLTAGSAALEGRLDGGPLQELILSAERSVAYVRILNQDLYCVLLLEAGGNLGKARLYSGYAGKRILEALS